MSDPSDELKQELGQMIRAAMNIVALLYARGRNHTTTGMAHGAATMARGRRKARRKVRGLDLLARRKARRLNRKARAASRTAIRRLSPIQRMRARKQIRQQIGAQNVARGWYAMRVDSYHDARLRYQKDHQQRWWSPEYSERAARAEHERLAAIRRGIETTLRTSPLSPEQRGQVVQALGAIDRNPSAAWRYATFRPLDAAGAAQARQDAQWSAQWLDHYAATRSQAQAPTRSAPAHRGTTPSSAPATTTGRAAVDTMPWHQLQAVQAIRQAQDRWRREPGEYREHMRAQAASNALRAGLTQQQIQHEFRTAHHNTVVTARISSARGSNAATTEVGHFATGAEAAAYANRYIARTSWVAGVSLRAEARQAGFERALFVSSGGEHKVTSEVARWHASHAPAATNGRSHTAARAARGASTAAKVSGMGVAAAAASRTNGKRSRSRR
ncbi:hypothetical protein [Nocardia sp. IFM 10818]